MLIIENTCPVSCVKDTRLNEFEHRQGCRIVLWQEIARASGRSLKEYLDKKYGIR